MTKTIAIANMKGGVGKTTLTVLLAEGLLAEGLAKRVLVIDLDAQAQASIVIAGEEIYHKMEQKNQTTTHFFAPLVDNISTKNEDFDGFVRGYVGGVPTAANIDLIASTPELQFLEREIYVAMAKRRFSKLGAESQTSLRLRAAIDFWKAKSNGDAPYYDYILIDCPPGISAFAEAGIRNSDIILSPLNADYLSLLGLDGFVRRAIPEMQKREKHKQLGKVYAIINRFKSDNNCEIYRKKIHSFCEQNSDVSVLGEPFPHMTAIPSGIELNERPTPYKQKYSVNAREQIKRFCSDVKGLDYD